MYNKYIVNITSQAENNIKSITEYLKHTFNDYAYADKWLNELMDSLEILEIFPYSCALVDVKPWDEKGFRKLIFKDYVVYFVVDEKQYIVWITSVVHGKRDQINQLRNMN